MIDKANLNRQVNVRTIAEAKNLPDSDKHIKKPYSPFIDALDKADKISETEFKYQDKLSIYEDSIAANKALLQAQNDISALNAEYMQKEGEDKINFYNKVYKKRYQEILTNFNQSVEPLKHDNISNDALDQMSKYNVKNCTSVELEQYNTVKKVNKDVLSNKATVKLGEMQEKFRTTPEAAMISLLGDINELRDIQNQIDAIDGIKVGGAKTGALAKYNGDVAASAGLAVAANTKLQRDQLDRTFSQAFAGTSNMIDAVAKQTNIDNVVRDKIKHDVLLEGLDIATKSHPEQFMENGVISDKKIDDASQHLLTQTERAKLINDATEAIKKNGGSLSGEEVVESEDYTRKFISDVDNVLQSIGITNKELTELDAMLNGEQDPDKKKAFEQSLEEIFSKVGIGRMVEVANFIDGWQDLDENRLNSSTGKRLHVNSSVFNKYSILGHRGLEMYIKRVAEEDYGSIDKRGTLEKLISPERANPPNRDWLFLNMVRAMKAYEFKDGKYKKLKNYKDKEYVERIGLAREALQQFDLASSSLLKNAGQGAYVDKYNNIMRFNVLDKESADPQFWEDARNNAFTYIEEYYNRVGRNTLKDYVQTAYDQRNQRIKDITERRNLNFVNSFDYNEVENDDMRRNFILDPMKAMGKILDPMGLMYKPDFSIMKPRRIQ